jgi:hypothetical protein
MNRRELILLLAGALTAARDLRAQQKAMPVIGYLSSGFTGHQILAAINFVECELPHKSLADPPLFLANEWSGVLGGENGGCSDPRGN